MSELRLTDDFPAPSETDWKALVEKGLRGAEFESLTRQTDDNLVRGPLTTSNDLPENISPLPRAGAPLLEGRPWHITAPVRDPDIAHANKQMLENLRGGASAVRLQLGPHGYGLNLKTSSDWKKLFDQVHTDLIPISIAPTCNRHLLSILQSIPSLKKAHINLGLGLQQDSALIKHIAAEVPSTWNLITIGTSKNHNFGNTEAQELGEMAHEAAMVFRFLGAEIAARHIVVELSVNQDAHLNIAKIRAARRIYARIAESFGIKNTKLRLHAVTSERMMQSIDPWTNMLRLMSATFGAIVGGADSITTHPFTQPLGLATSFGHRISRNMQLMLMEESQLGQVKDAAYGSYFHERMTENLAQKAWKIFQISEGCKTLEESNAALKHIDPKGFLSQTDNPRKSDPILGVNLHPLEKDSTAYREPKIRSAST